MSVVVRRAEERDLEAIVAIYNHAIENTLATFDLEPFEVDARRAWFEGFDDEHPLRVATREEVVVGFAYYGVFRNKPGYARTKEMTVYVAPDATGTGVGDALYAALIEHATQRGVHVLIAVLAAHNPASIALHRKHHFVPVGHLRQVGYKHGTWVDTHYWQRINEAVRSAR